MEIDAKGRKKVAKLPDPNPLIVVSGSGSKVQGDGMKGAIAWRSLV